MSIVKPHLSSLIIGSLIFIDQGSSSISATEYEVRFNPDYTTSSGPKGIKSQGIVFDEQERQTMRGSLHADASTSRKELESFIQEGIKLNPLPPKSAVQEDLLNSGMLRNIAQVINEAYDYNPDSMAILGGLYFRGVDIDNAIRFLFPSAWKRNAEAFWLLSSMYRNNYLTSTIPNLDALLLNEADQLGSTDAKRYKQESGLI